MDAGELADYRWGGLDNHETKGSEIYWRENR